MKGEGGGVKAEDRVGRWPVCDRVPLGLAQRLRHAVRCAPHPGVRHDEVREMWKARLRKPAA